MPGNMDKNVVGQKEISGGKGGKMGGFDSLITEKSGDTGAASMPTIEAGEFNTPKGQKVC